MEVILLAWGRHAYCCKCLCACMRGRVHVHFLRAYCLPSPRLVRVIGAAANKLRVAPVFLLWHLTSSPYRFSALSQFVSPYLFLRRRSPGRLRVIDTYHWPWGSDGVPPLLLPPIAEPADLFLSGCNNSAVPLAGDSYREIRKRGDATVGSYGYEHAPLYVEVKFINCKRSTD